MLQQTNLKVCGLTRPEDMRQAAESGVRFAGMIFYAPSPRYAEGKLDPEEVKAIQGILKVGVFVNADTAYILERREQYGLDIIQLHGDESPEDCRALRTSVPVIKAFRLRKAGDLELLPDYEDACDYFLFDTPGSLYGGNGTLFEWSLLDDYRGNTPFFLSGGIGPGDSGRVKAFSHPMLYAIDVNSLFEIRPGEKNILDIKKFLWDLNSI